MAETSRNTGNVPSLFTSSSEIISISKQKLIVRHLKMVNSSILFISDTMMECINELSVAIPTSDNEVVSTTCLGTPGSNNSANLAESLSKLVNRQIFVNLNVNLDFMEEKLLENKLSDFLLRDLNECSQI